MSPVWTRSSSPRTRGEVNIQHRSRDALGARVFRNVGRVSCESSVTHYAERWVSLRSTHPTKRNDDQEKKEAERRQTCVSTSASFDAARVRRDALAYRRSTTALTVRAFGPWAQLQARLPWDVAGRSILYGRSNPRAKILRSYTGVTRARLSQSRERTSRTGRSAGQMMPEAARERSVSFRARAPHSLHLPEYPRPKASFTERDSNAGLVTENRTHVKTWSPSRRPRKK